MTDKEIAIIVVAYKDKNILDFVTNIKNSTKSRNMLYIMDQHPLDRELEISGIPGCSYRHVIWDSIDGPATHRARKIHDLASTAEYMCIVSPDITLKDGWDLELIDRLDRGQTVLSGSGKISVALDSLFSIKPTYSQSDDYSTTQFIDKNFIFLKSSAFADIVVPDFLKYYGENEYLSLALMSAGYSIVSVPSDTYTDSQVRSVETTYHTFSAEHNYNTVVDLLAGTSLKKYRISYSALCSFLEFHGLDMAPIKRLPYQTNDVEYDPYAIAMHDVDARRFIAGTKAVY